MKEQFIGTRLLRKENNILKHPQASVLAQCQQGALCSQLSQSSPRPWTLVEAGLPV